MIEVCFVLSGERILRVDFGSLTRVPDRWERWELIWGRRGDITEIVHTHPGGFLAFSEEDLTTMEAIEAATGQRFTWSVVTRHGWLRRHGLSGRDQFPEPGSDDSPWWLGPLRDLSFSPSPIHPEPRKEVPLIP